MDIAYYMPFKPLGHTSPSGDLFIGTEIYNHLKNRGHSVRLVSRIRCRWIYYKPFHLVQLLRERNRIIRNSHHQKPDLWLSYHCYYKAPDLLGSACSKSLAIPYTIFQGIYSTKRRKKLKTLPGFLLNRRILTGADHIFTNKKRDLKNLKRLITTEKLTYIRPGIIPEDFQFNPEYRDRFRRKWNCRDTVIVLTAAMMRPGVKAEGIATVINSCSKLHRRGYKIKLVIIGDGQCRQELERRASEATPLEIRFIGQIPRQRLQNYYSAADIFAFPGVDESLGMVYLEAQSCKLPIVAYENWGGGEAVIHSRTGLLSPASEPDVYTQHIEHLVTQRTLRQTLGENGSEHIRRHHDINKNYRKFEEILLGLTKKNK